MLCLFFFRSLFRHIERLQPASAMNPVLADIVFHIHDILRRQRREACLDHPQDIVLAEVQAQDPQQRQEILSVSAHQDGLILFCVKGDAGGGKCQREKRWQRVLLTDGNRHILPRNSLPVPGDQRLAGVLTLQIGILGVIDPYMGHIRYFRAVQISHGLLFRFSGIRTDHGDAIFALIDLLAGKGTVCVDAFFHIGNAGINGRNHGFTLLRERVAVVAEIVRQRKYGIIGGAENLPVRADIIADQPDDNLCRPVAVRSIVRNRRVNKVQNIVRDVVEAVDEELGVPDQSAFADMINR